MLAKCQKSNMSEITARPLLPPVFPYFDTQRLYIQYCTLRCVNTAYDCTLSCSWVNEAIVMQILNSG